MNRTLFSQTWDTPFRAVRALENALDIASYGSKAALVGALTMPIPFYWNPPFWTIALSWPRIARNTKSAARSTALAKNATRTDNTHANDNLTTNRLIAA